MSAEQLSESELATEAWLDIPGRVAYQVSDLGRVRSCRKAGHWKTPSAGLAAGYHLLKPHVHANGYLSVQLIRGRWDLIHRLVLLAFVGPCPEGMECRHADGSRVNNRLTNLCWGTRIENNADKVRHGTAPLGEQCHTAKLSDADAVEIRRRHAAGESRPALAAAFGVARSNISMILRGVTFAHLPGVDPQHCRSRKLSAAAVVEIRRRAAAGDKQRAIAADFGISQAMVSLIVSRKHLRDVG